MVFVILLVLQMIDCILSSKKGLPDVIAVHVVAASLTLRLNNKASGFFHGHIDGRITLRTL
jgi:hypothetical protein